MNSNFNEFTTAFPQAQQNYYQPAQTMPIYTSKNWQQQYYQQPVVSGVNYQQQQQVQPVNNYMQWVQGEAGAKAYNLPNNTTIPLWDSESQTIYIKTVDQNGKPTMTILDYIERDSSDSNPETKKQETVEYATKEQIDSLTEQLTSINKKFGSMDEYVTDTQFKDMNTHINELSNQIKSIEDRITSFGKSQSNNYNNKRGNK